MNKTTEQKQEAYDKRKAKNKRRDELLAKHFGEAEMVQSLQDDGLLVPIELDETGQIVDGFIRQRLCAQLGVKTKYINHLGEPTKMEIRDDSLMHK